MDTLVEYYQKLLLALSGLVLAVIGLIGVARGLNHLGFLRKLCWLFRMLGRPRSWVAWVCIAPLTCFLLVMGSEKTGGGNSTNSPSLSAPLRLLHYIQQAISSNDVARGYRISENTDDGGIVPMPTGSVTNELLRSRGGYDWAFRVEPDGWRFPYRDGFLEGVTVLARGEVRPDIGTLFFPLPFTNGVSLLPEAKWGQFPNAESSVFSHAVTDGGSLLLDWHNALVGRDPNSPTNLQLELFRDGSFSWRTDDVSQFYLPVFPFDWDNDGLENSVDPEPLVANPVDAHGTNAEWYDIVCSNVFENVGGVASFKVDVNSNAYYYAEVVAFGGPAPIYFNADRVSRLGSPIVAANCGATNRVPLLVGVEYTVTSTVPISVSAPDAMYATVTSNGLCYATVKWPLEFEFVENVGPSNRTYTVSVGPCDPGGEFSWGGSHGGGAMLMSAPPDSSCACYSAMGNIVTFSCSPTCDCNAECAATGEYRYEAAMFAVTGGVCRCGFDDPPPPEEPTDDPLYEPNFSINFSKSAVIFEASYMDSPGITKPKRSTRVRLTISANGGPNGGTFLLAHQNLDKLNAITEEPILLPSSMTLAPGQSFYTTCVYEAGTASVSAKDIYVQGYLIERDTNERYDAKGELTVVKVEVKPEVTAPANQCTYRHTFGVYELVNLEHTPQIDSVTWKLVGGGTTEGSVDGYVGQGDIGKKYTLRCPLYANGAKLKALYGDCEYSPAIKFVEPNGIVAYNQRPAGGKDQIPKGVVGCSMWIDLYVTPMDVSFTEIAVEEVPSNSSTYSGYFQNSYSTNRRSHNLLTGAGEWTLVKSSNVDDLREGVGNFLMRDTVTTGWLLCVDEYGEMSWDIPMGWHKKPVPPTGTLPFREFAQGQYKHEFKVWVNGDAWVRKHQKEMLRHSNEGEL